MTEEREKPIMTQPQGGEGLWALKKPFTAFFYGLRLSSVITHTHLWEEALFLSHRKRMIAPNPIKTAFL